MPEISIPAPAAAGAIDRLSLQTADARTGTTTNTHNYAADWCFAAEPSTQGNYCANCFAEG